MIEEFRISFEEARFAELRRRVVEARFPVVPSRQDGDGGRKGDTVREWALGTPARVLEDVLDYWVNEYSWRPKEAELNGFPQFVWDSGGVKIHFFHIASAAKDAPTVLMCHGWPDSFLRYAKTFPLLRECNLVVPSMPGFAFSTLPPKGFTNNSAVADLWHTLMRDVLGYDSYFVTGGDMGRGVACYIASRHREVRGLFLTDVGLAADLVSAPDSSLTAEELRYKMEATRWMREDGAYISIQGTKPRSLGYGLSDSPAGMVGWLLEKFHDWSDWERFSREDLCDNLTLYWMCNCAASSLMAYHGNGFTLPPMGKVSQPVGIAQFPKDILPVPRSWIERHYNLVQYSEMPYGGHFTAMEAPVPFADALREFIFTNK